MSLLRQNDEKPTPNEVFEEALRHVPLTVLVELVEARYRDRRNRAFWAVVATVLSLLVGTAAVGYQVYRWFEDQAAEEQAQQQLQQQKDARLTEYMRELERRESRLQFARTWQSFGNIDGQLSTNRTLPVNLVPGERKQFSLELPGEGRYRIRVNQRKRPDAADEVVSHTLFTPVMYLYRRLENQVVEPLVATASGTLSFVHNNMGVYYLEVEELLRDPGEFSLSLGYTAREEG